MTRLLFAIGLLWAISVNAQESLSISVGHEFSQGNYGSDTPTYLHATNLQAKYLNNSWSFRASIPYLQLDGPSAVSTETTSTTTSANRNRRIEGMGDTTLSASYFVTLAENEWLEMGSKLKAPTANRNSGLGTGEYDWALESFYYRNHGNLTGIIGGGYKWNGRRAQDTFQDTDYYSLGLIYSLSATTRIGIMTDSRRSLYADQPRIREATTFLHHQINRKLALQTYCYTGFTTASPDFGLGLSLQSSFD